MDEISLADLTSRWGNTEVVARHPELHHYTSVMGLEGMLSTQTLWATHFKYLNDTSEVFGIEGQMSAELALSFETILRRRRMILSVHKAIAANGGLKRFARTLADSFYSLLSKVTFYDSDEPASETVSGTPYIFSFCSHEGEDYEKRNGLLSQWRGYARDNGVCIVFDTKQILSKLDEEFASRSYTHVSFDDVIYAKDGFSLTDQFPDFFDDCDTYVRIKFGQKIKDPGAETIAGFITAATRYKHRAFMEEREVRIVACPTPPSFFDDSPRSGISKLPQKETFTCGERDRIALFENQSSPLPIKRIIVGPSKNKSETAETVKAIVHGRWPVDISETPYIEP